MGVRKKLPGLGGGGPVVDITLANPSIRPGLTLHGELTITCGKHDVPIDYVVLGLFTAVQTECEDSVLMEFHRVVASRGFPVLANTRRTVPLAVPVPWETPITHLRGGYPLPGMTMGLRVETEATRTADRYDLVAVYVYPLPVQEQILDAFLRLGFQLRRSGLQTGRIRRVAQTLPFYQDIGFWAASDFADRITEVGLTFVADPYGVDAILSLDRWASADVGVRTSTARLRVEHAKADRTDWDQVVGGWVREAVERHAGGRPQRRPGRHIGVRPGEGLVNTAGGEHEDHQDGTGETT